MAFEAIMAEVDQLNLAGDRIGALRDWRNIIFQCQKH
jgi:hypothetical protein